MFPSGQPAAPLIIHSWEVMFQVGTVCDGGADAPPAWLSLLLPKPSDFRYMADFSIFRLKLRFR